VRLKFLFFHAELLKPYLPEEVVLVARANSSLAEHTAKEIDSQNR
jgi:hypothetical protein